MVLRFDFLLAYVVCITNCDIHLYAYSTSISPKGNMFLF